MTRFVALGDSITLGVGDPVPAAAAGRAVPAGTTGGAVPAGTTGGAVPAGTTGGAVPAGTTGGAVPAGTTGGALPADRTGRRAWRGWAALLAAGLCEPVLHNLAANGACIADVERDQLPRALQLQPDIASVVVGVNDTLRPNFEPTRIAASAAHTVGALRAADAVVLTMRMPDPGRMLGVPGVLARPLARRAQEINRVMDAVARRFDTLHFDAAGDAETYDPSMWAADRLHPSERGHRLIARRYHEMLAAAGCQVGPPPELEPANPPPTRLEELAWLATKGTAWVLRRSTDLVPSLLAMAFAEWHSGRKLDPAGLQDPEVAGGRPARRAAPTG
jgi:lysophospholipase L1-like esterase